MKTYQLFFSVAIMLIIVSCNDNSESTKTNKDTTATINDVTPEQPSAPANTAATQADFVKSMNDMLGKMQSTNMTGDFDIDFANMMIEHHQGAVDMANIEITASSDEKMKAMAQDIVTGQTAKNNQLKEFVKTYKPSGMKHGEDDMEKMLAEMKMSMAAMTMSGNADKDFATLMISHHEAGIKMSKAQLKNGMSDSLKNMAKKGIADETKEINEFKTWLAANK